MLLNAALRHGNQRQATQVVLSIGDSALKVLCDCMQRVAILLLLLLMAALIGRPLHVYTGLQIAAATSPCCCD